MWEVSWAEAGPGARPREPTSRLRGECWQAAGSLPPGTGSESAISPGLTQAGCKAEMEGGCCGRLFLAGPGCKPMSYSLG